MSYGCPYFAFSDYRNNIAVKERTCIGCMQCMAICPRHVFSFDKAKNTAVAKHTDACMSCFRCLSTCPVGAISISAAEQSNAM